MHYLRLWLIIVMSRVSHFDNAKETKNYYHCSLIRVFVIKSLLCEIVLEITPKFAPKLIEIINVNFNCNFLKTMFSAYWRNVFNTPLFCFYSYKVMLQLILISRLCCVQVSIFPLALMYVKRELTIQKLKTPASMLISTFSLMK